MTQINMHAAKTNLSKLIADVEDGEEVTLCRSGKPVARIVPAPKTGGKRQFGILAGEIWISEDFDTPNGDLFGVSA